MFHHGGDMTECLALYIRDVYLDSNLPPAPPPNNVARVMKGCVFKMLFNNEDAFKKLTEHVSIIPWNANVALTMILNKVFEDNIVHWGRIILIYAVLGQVTTLCKRNNAVERSDDIVDFTVNYMNRQLIKCWMHANGGWADFAEKFEEPSRFESWLENLLKALTF